MEKLLMKVKMRVSNKETQGRKEIDKKYEPLKIPVRQQGQADGSVTPPPKGDNAIPLSDGLFYEIEYDSNPVNIEGVGKFVLKSQKIEAPAKDEIRDLFSKMRDISRQYRSPLVNHAKFYDRNTQRENAKIFYKQAVFMKDFADGYTEQAPFSSYFPFYQVMSYEQLRTYFTWRTQVREGSVAKTSLSYIFLYIYELLNNVGAESPQDGLDKLVSFWNAVKAFDDSINKYVYRWLKDYHVYYNLPQSFKDFAEEHNLTDYYPKMADSAEKFDLFCAISKYDVKKSAFFRDETGKLITDCFYFVMDRLRREFDAAGINLDNALFRPTKKIINWQPFRDALFYGHINQTDRRVVLSENEIYICKDNEWTFSTMITSDGNKKLIGYIFKQMEAVLRQVVKYKHKLTADINTLDQTMLLKMKELGLPLDKIIYGAVIEFYREATKTVVTVDHGSLTRIRREAMVTQEALTVEEQCISSRLRDGMHNVQVTIMSNPVASKEHIDIKPESTSDSWEGFKAALNAAEIQAISIILHGNTDIKQFAGDNGVMPEVLADGINEKAMDHIGDNLLDDEIAIYEDYKEQLENIFMTM